MLTIDEEGLHGLSEEKKIRRVELKWGWPLILEKEFTGSSNLEGEFNMCSNITKLMINHLK